MFDLVGLGNPVYDIIVTPETKTDGRVLSGCSTNACLAAKRLGLGKVGLIGSMGPDYVERFCSDMIRYGIEAQMEATSKETGGFHLIYDDKGDRTLDIIGVADRITAKNIPEPFLKSKFILIGPILGEVTLELAEFIRSSTSAKIFLDPQGLLRTIGEDGRIIHKCDRASFDKIASLVDFIKPNERESETITGERDPVLALKRLSQLGHAVPIVTLAERGSVLLTGDEFIRIPPYPTRAIDPTGAGDVYGGSFITEYDRTGNLTESALFASAAASMMVEQVGPDFRITREEVLKRRESIQGNLTVEK